MFFGLIKKYAVLTIIPSLKILNIKTNIKNFYLKESDFLEIDEFYIWCKKNNYKISYNTKNGILRRILNFMDK